jgi:hypothetical protein
MIKLLKVVFAGRNIHPSHGKLTRPIQQRILRPTDTIFNNFVVIHIKSCRILLRFINSDHGLIRHTEFFVLLFNTVHPEDGRRRWPKHVGVVGKQRI